MTNFSRRILENASILCSRGINPASKLRQIRGALVPCRGCHDYFFEAAETTFAHHVLPAAPPRVHLTVHRILAAIVITRGLLRRLPGDRARTRAERSTHTAGVYTVYSRLPHHGNNMHTWRMDARRRRSSTGAGAGGREGGGEEEEEKAVVMMHNTIRYGSQKIRDADTRARHVSSRINEGCLHSPPSPSPFSSPLSFCLLFAREICCESVGTLTREI